MKNTVLSFIFYNFYKHLYLLAPLIKQNHTIEISVSVDEEVGTDKEESMLPGAQLLKKSCKRAEYNARLMRN